MDRNIAVSRLQFPGAFWFVDALHDGPPIPVMRDGREKSDEHSWQEQINKAVAFECFEDLLPSSEAAKAFLRSQRLQFHQFKQCEWTDSQMHWLWQRPRFRDKPPEMVDWQDHQASGVGRYQQWNRSARSVLYGQWVGGVHVVQLILPQVLLVEARLWGYEKCLKRYSTVLKLAQLHVPSQQWDLPALLTSGLVQTSHPRLGACAF